MDLDARLAAAADHDQASGGLRHRSRKDDSQLDGLIACGCHTIFTGKVSGKLAGRPELGKALACLREGDVFVITRLSRAMRSLKHLLILAGELRECGVMAPPQPESSSGQDVATCDHNGVSWSRGPEPNITLTHATRARTSAAISTGSGPWPLLSSAWPSYGR
jgi:Resolvase, N terminal domain